MVQVKIFKGSTKLIERDINEWLQNLRKDINYTFNIMDIKFNNDVGDVSTAMIIYSIKQNPTSHSQNITLSSYQEEIENGTSG